MFLSLFMVYNSMIVLMYNTRVISMLTTSTEPLKLNTLDDLLLPEFSHIRSKNYIS